MKIMFIEDNQGFGEIVRDTLSRQHYLVHIATDGEMGLEFAAWFEYDLILLDFLLPETDGIQFCKKRRQEGDTTPILLMTAQDSTALVVKALDRGADDYLVKPFDLEELLARIRALLRRGNLSLPPVMEWVAHRLEPSNCKVSYQRKPLRLTGKEYGLLELLLRHLHRIFSQSGLLERLWCGVAVKTESTVRTHIKSLRQKLKKAGATGDLIETVYGLGYRFNQNVNQQFPSKTVQKQHKSDQKNAVKGRLVTIWQQQKPQYLGRVEVLSEAVKAMIAGSCSAKLRAEAENEAHTLAGAIGIFGLVEGSGLSREIEQILVAQEKLSRGKIQKLCSLVGALRESIEGYHSRIATGNVIQVSASDSLPRLLIVDDDPGVRRALAKEAIAWKMEQETAENLATARKACCRRKPDVILLDLSFPEDTEDGLELFKERIKYRKGEILLMSSILRHGREANILADLVRVLLDKQNRNYEAFTPITMELPQEHGIEPDYCFYINNWQTAVGKDSLNWQIEPPPDLVIEIDVTNYTNVNDYLPYQVPEVWLLKKKKLKIYGLQQGGYELRSLSLYFPEIDLLAMSDSVFQRAAKEGIGVAIRELRQMLSLS